jgi:hypothetical protein
MRDISISKGQIFLIAMIIVGAVALGFPYISSYLHPSLSAKTSGSSGSGVTVTAQPYVDYTTSSGVIIREYLNTGQIYYIYPNGQEVPYTNPDTFIAPGTTTEVTYVTYGFTLNVGGQYLKGSSGTAQAITIDVTAHLNNNASGTYSVFNNQAYQYSVSGVDSSPQSTPETVTSAQYNITTLAQDIWGASFNPSATAEYYPSYSVTISANATSLWGQPLTATATQTYPYSTIGAWMWASPQLSISLGSASATTQSVAGELGQPSVQAGIVVAIVIAALAVLIARRER